MRIHPHIPVIFLAVAAAIIAVVVHGLYFPYLSDNADEAVYLQQAQALLDGHLRFARNEVAPAGQDRPVGFTQLWLTGYHNHGYFTKYQPGYPALIAVSMLLFGGSPLGALALAAAAWILGVYALAYVLFGSRAIALTAAAVLTFSPIFFMQAPVYLSYATSCALMCAGIAAVVYGARCRADCHPHCVRDCHRNCQRVRWLVAGGLLWGAWLTVRQFDVALVVVTVMAYVIYRWGRDWQHLRRILFGVAAGGLPGLLVVMAFAYKVTGSPLHMPLAATDPLDAFGFGPRRILPGERVFDFTAGQAWNATINHWLVTPRWMLGGLICVAFALVGLLAGRTHRGSRVLIALLTAAFTVGYFPFWGMMLANFLRVYTQGPLYYITVLTLLAVLAGRGVVLTVRAAASWLSARQRPCRWPVRVAAAVVVVASLLISSVNLRDVFDHQRQVTARAEAIIAGMPPWSTLQQPAVIIVSMRSQQRYVGAPYQVISNPYLGAGNISQERLDHPVIYAASHAEQDARIAQALPGRALYGYRLPDLELGKNRVVPSSAFVPLQLIGGQAVQVAMDVTVPVTKRCLVAYLIIDGKRRVRPLACGNDQQRVQSLNWQISAAEVAQIMDSPIPRQGLSTEIIMGVASADEPIPVNPEGISAKAWWSQAKQVEYRASALVQSPAWRLTRGEVDDYKRLRDKLSEKQKKTITQIKPPSPAMVQVWQQASMQVLTPPVPWVGEVLEEDGPQEWDVQPGRRDVLVDITPVPAAAGDAGTPASPPADQAAGAPQPPQAPSVPAPNTPSNPNTPSASDTPSTPGTPGTLSSSGPAPVVGLAE